MPIQARIHERRALPTAARVSKTISQASLVGTFDIVSGTKFMNTTFGGISALTYNQKRDEYYLLSDDGTDGLVRFYTAKINISRYVVRIIKVTVLTRSTGERFVRADIDPEGIEFSKKGTIFVSSEKSPPAVLEFGLDGKLIRYLNVPDYHFPNPGGTFGVRRNLAFEGLSLSPDKNTLWAANEGALAQDGPEASLTEKSPARMVGFDANSGIPKIERVYFTEKVAREPVPSDGFADNGLTAIVALDNKGGRFLALERSYSDGTKAPDRGYRCRLYEVHARGSKNVLNMPRLDKFTESMAVRKHLVVDLADFGVVQDNLEGMVLVISGRKGRRTATLVIVADDNFSRFGAQSNQFLFVRLKGKF